MKDGRVKGENLTVRVSRAVDNGNMSYCLVFTGGPLYHKEDDGQLTILGIASRIQTPDCGTDPGIYVEVSWFIDWIEKAIKDNP